MNRDTRRTRALLALLLLTSICLITIDYRGGEGSPLDGVRSFAAAVFGPVEQVAAAIASPISGAVDRVGDLGNGTTDAERLAKQNKELRRKLRTSELARNRAAELDALLKVAGIGRYKVVPAQVIAIGAAQTFSWTVTIDAGTRDGVRPDMTVLNGDGLVGRVKTSGPTTSDGAAGGRPRVVGGRAARGLDGGRLHDRPGHPGQRRARPAPARRPVDRQRGRPAGQLRLAGRPALRARGARRGGRVGARHTRLPDPHGERPAVRRLHLSRPRRRGGRATAHRPARRRAAAAPGGHAAADGHRHGDADSPSRRGGADVPAGRVFFAVLLLVVALAVQVAVLARLPLPGATPDLVLLARRLARARARPGLRAGRGLRGGPGHRPRAAGRPRRRALGARAHAGGLLRGARAGRDAALCVRAAVRGRGRRARRACCSTPGSAR